MSKIVITVEDVSKLYRLGQVGTGTISNDLKKWWYQVRGKEDPFLQIGRSNDRAEDSGTLDYVWSLKDINFEVKQGEVLGIIGGNGAGKSTLLKILSKITAPTTGQISIEGRVASLLEVGTGFHPELTGRENIYLNGTILGMNKAEVHSKLEEIVDFSGVAKYLDTPVKRYSSGMLVRLGFAIAAHLEPEILIVDEVLAVGDAEFQRKCVGKMKDVSSEGRTVLFVSHNMAAVRSLCTRAIHLEKGILKNQGNVNNIVESYLSNGSNLLNHKVFQDEIIESSQARLLELGCKNRSKEFSDPIYAKEEIEVYIKLEIANYDPLVDISLQFRDDQGDVVFTVHSLQIDNFIRKKGILSISALIQKNFFNEGNYSIDFLLWSNKKVVEIRKSNVLTFRVILDPLPLGFWMGRMPGALKPTIDWVVNN
jgi:lipopolysaccharide transport system ATP-binding protein